MHDAGGMGGRQPVGDLRRQLQGAARPQPICANRIAQRLAIDQLGNDVRNPALVSDIINSDDVWMV